MKRTLTMCVLCICCGPLWAADGEPISSFQDLFRQAARRLAALPVLAPEARSFSSELDRTDGGVKSPEGGLSLLTSERMMEGACTVSGCAGLGAFSLSQRRSGLAWNFASAQDMVRFAPHVDVIRFQMAPPGQVLPAVSSLGFGLGLDGRLRLDGQTWLYASGCKLQLAERSGNEGTLGLSHDLDSRSRIFVEAKWVDLSAQTRFDSGYNMSNVRLGLMQRFSAF